MEEEGKRKRGSTGGLKGTRGSSEESDADKKIGQETKIRLIESTMVAISVDNQALNTAINAADYTMKSSYFSEEVKQAAANEMTEKRQLLNRNMAEMQKFRSQLQELQCQQEDEQGKEQQTKKATITKT